MGLEQVSDTGDLIESTEVDWSRPANEAKMDEALDEAFPPGPESDGSTDLDQALDEAFPDEPGGLDYEPSSTGVSYPDPERMEGNVGGPEKLG